LRTRIVIVAAIALLVAVPAFFLLRSDTGVPGDAPTVEAMADAVGGPIMEHVRVGHVAGRSGEIMLVPKPHRFLVGEWDLRRLGTDNLDEYTSHPNPWDYITEVPLVLYGPSYIKQGSIDEPVDITALAPTYARLMGMETFTSDGTALSALLPNRRRPPKMIFTIVIDGGGWNALRYHPGDHPAIDSLIEGGASYTNATIGSAPSITGALHATFGTGFYPITAGIPGNQLRGEGGDPTVDAWLENADPRFLEVPTVSELWDEANGNKPIVGTVSYEGWHLGMIGHGAQRDGGDRDIAVLWDYEENSWTVNEDYYELPDYLLPTDLEKLDEYESELDARDGAIDGLWFTVPPEEYGQDNRLPGTPAFARFTGDAIMKVLRNEAWAKDDLTDLFWVELKPPDFGGHYWNVTGPEQADLIRETDKQIARFVSWLDSEVGEGNYVLALSADHGQQPLPELEGGWRINGRELQRDINRVFANDVAQLVTPVEIFVDMGVVAENDIDLDDIARYIGAYTIEENIPEDARGVDRVPRDRLDERLFAGAFPTEFLQSLTAEDTARYGDSDYPEGNFEIPR
jgi:arylsulfatase A-like enzyme